MGVPLRRHHRFSAAISRVRSLLGSGVAALLFAQSALAHQTPLSLRGHAPRAVPALAAVLNAAPVAGLPPAFASHVHVRRVLPGTRPGVVVLIEDVHQNVEAQTHLSQALTALGETAGRTPVRVALEGAAGAVVFDGFHDLPGEPVRRVADQFLAAGDLGGPSHAGITARPRAGARGLAFHGAEDAALYRRNVEALRRANGSRPHVIRGLELAHRRLLARRVGAFSPALLRLDDAIERHAAGKAGLGDHARLLSAHAPATLTVERFLAAWDAERAIDPARVDRERRRVLERLVARLDDAATGRLVSLSLGYRDGSVTHGAYHAELRRLCARAGVRLADTPAFDAYLRYVLLADGIDGARLLADVAAMEEAATASLAATDEARALAAALGRARLARGLVTFSLTTAQWSAYQRRVPSSADLAPFEAFYRAAEARNDAMAARVSLSEPAVLVAGGFHTEGLLPRLARDGRTVVVCAPKLTRADAASASAYLSVFDREKTPLERLFAGEKIFLAAPPLGATPLVDAPNPAPLMRHYARALAAAPSPSKPTVVAAATAARPIRTVVAPVGTPSASFPWRTLERRLFGDTAISIEGLPAWMTIQNVAVSGMAAAAAVWLGAGAPAYAALPMLMMLGMVTTGGSSPDDRARSLPELFTDGHGVHPWIEGVSREMIRLPGRDIVTAARELTNGTPANEALRAELSQTLLAKLARSGGFHGANITAAGILPDLHRGDFDEEIRVLLAGGVTDPGEILAEIMDAVTTVADAALAAGGITGPGLRVAQEADTAAAVVEGGEPAVITDVLRTANLPRRAVRIAAHLYGRKGFERRGAVDRLVYTTVLEGVVPQISLNFGVHTYVLTAKAFLYGLLGRTGEMADLNFRDGVPADLGRQAVANEVTRLSQSMNAVSETEVVRAPEIGFDALLDTAILAMGDELSSVANPEGAAALRERITRLEAARGVGGIAMAKVSHLIHGHIFHGIPLDRIDASGLTPEREIEQIFGGWIIADIQDARGTVLQIQADTAAPGRDGILPYQRFMIAAPADGSAVAAVRLGGLAGGWSSDRSAEPAALHPEEIGPLEDFLHQVGLPRRELVDEGIPVGVLSQEYLAATLTGKQSPRVSPFVTLRAVNEAVKYLHSRGLLPEKLSRTAEYHSREPSLNDVVEAVQADQAERLAETRRNAQAAVHSAVERMSAHRNLEGRAALVSIFIAPALILSGVSLAVAPGVALWIAALAWAAPGVLFAHQAAALALASTGLSSWKGVVNEAARHHRDDAQSSAGRAIAGRVFLNWSVLGRLSFAQQRSVIREEERHVRYQLGRRNGPGDLLAPRTAGGILREELVVNVIMPIQDALSALLGSARATRDRVVDAREARRWLRDGATLAERLDAWAPRGPIFGPASEGGASETRWRFHRAAAAGALRVVAARGVAPFHLAIAYGSRTSAARVVVYHLNQLEDPAVLASELAEYEAALARARLDRESGAVVSVVAAVSGELPAAARERLAALARRESSAIVTVTDDLLADDGFAFSYERLLEAAIEVGEGADTTAARRLLSGNYDDGSFVTFSKIPAQFLADGRLRRMWTLFSNVGPGWALVPVDVLYRAAVMAQQHA